MTNQHPFTSTWPSRSPQSNQTRSVVDEKQSLALQPQHSVATKRRLQENQHRLLRTHTHSGTERDSTNTGTHRSTSGSGPSGCGLGQRVLSYLWETSGQPALWVAFIPACIHQRRRWGLQTRPGRRTSRPGSSLCALAYDKKEPKKQKQGSGREICVSGRWITRGLRSGCVRM